MGQRQTLPIILVSKLWQLPAESVCLKRSEYPKAGFPRSAWISAMDWRFFIMNIIKNIYCHIIIVWLMKQVLLNLPANLFSC